MNHVTFYSTSEYDVTWAGFKSMFIYRIPIMDHSEGNVVSECVSQGVTQLAGRQ